MVHPALSGRVPDLYPRAMKRLLTVGLVFAALVAGGLPAGADGDRLQEARDAIAAARPGGGGGGSGTGGGVTPEASSIPPVNSPFLRADSLGDVPYSGGDITAWKVEHSSDTIKLRMRTRVGNNPNTANQWVQGATVMLWGIDVNNGGGADFAAGFYNDGSGLVGEVILNDEEGTHVCDATPTYYGGNGYMLTFDRSCIGNPASFRAWVGLIFDKYWFDPNAPVSVDFGPNNGWSPRVRPVG